MNENNDTQILGEVNSSSEVNCPHEKASCAN